MVAVLLSVPEDGTDTSRSTGVFRWPPSILTITLEELEGLESV